MKYALYLGCTAPVRAINYELAARKTAERFGIELVDLNHFSCCGFPVKSVKHETALLMAARNLALAEEKGLNVCALCNSCSSTLLEANKRLQEDEELRAKINEKLLASTGKRYEGTIKVRHFARVLYEEVGVAKIREKVTVDLSALNLAAHYGCHYLKPSSLNDSSDDPEHPTSLDELIEATGARSVFYEDRNQCCGGGILGIEEQTALALPRRKLDHVKASGAEALVVICPFCDIMYELNQRRIEKLYQTEYRLPILYYPQLLGLALGFPPNEVGLELNRVRPRAGSRLAELLGR